MLDYFYGPQADLFFILSAAQSTFCGPQIRGISAESKILYGLLLDRRTFSQDVWTDDTGRIYIIFRT